LKEVMFVNCVLEFQKFLNTKKIESAT